ncbi:putative AT hook motif-containing protein [Neospora caninum Liverpool]|uniref:AT hook motif-containing protein, putative n=1 Tax=Neospora caninum (strain Liverpool) TaxID=572307 RepID=F0VAZ3_NEOCL|nr:putative AT hook motif-containing protein [Neospora caninum Liverpool]CBZ51369.1 putative AT hook motif-containing protein [Neospora caninum Liverpool]CEL68688.1 TPA: AT hook motif-containing protein, putative [Neospora caninum Liverpool]|eukprot:XP_003881402.1 putative AT hook motif-containing protein [Neospora caninum Liverpool]
MEGSKTLPDSPASFESKGETRVKDDEADSSHSVELKEVSSRQGSPDASTRCSLVPDASPLRSPQSEKNSSASLILSGESPTASESQQPPAAVSGLRAGVQTPQAFASPSGSLPNSLKATSTAETIPNAPPCARSAEVGASQDAGIEAAGERSFGTHEPRTPLGGRNSAGSRPQDGSPTGGVSPAPLVRSCVSTRESSARVTRAPSPNEERNGNPRFSASASSWGARADAARGRSAVVAAGAGRALRLAAASEGSLTVVDGPTPAREWLQRLHSQAARPTPLLRLRVHPETGQVTRASKVAAEDDACRRRGGPPSDEAESEEGWGANVSRMRESLSYRKGRCVDGRGGAARGSASSAGAFSAATAAASHPARSHFREELDDAQGTSARRLAASAGRPGLLMRPPSLATAFPSALATTQRFRYRSTSVATSGRGSSQGFTGEQVFERDTYTDTVHSSEDSGLTWGEKRAKDGSWREKWMQQTIEEEEEEKTDGEAQGEERGSGGPRTRRTRRRTFGQNHGIHEGRRERWSERWDEVEGRRRTVEKAVQQLDEGGNVVQEWFEVIEENLETGETKLTKAGEDLRDYFGSLSGAPSPREETAERGDQATAPGAVPADALLSDGDAKNERPRTTGRRARLARRWKEESHRRVSAETGEDEEVWTAFEESQAGRENGRRRRREGRTGTEETEVWYRAFDLETGATKETWEERWVEKADGEKWGEKKGVNTQNEEWGEKWRENAAGEREVDRWAQTEDGRRRWGEKKGRSRPKKVEEGNQEDGQPVEATTPEDYTERWEIEHRDDTYVSFTDRWWQRPEEGTRWGEKKKLVHSAVKRQPDVTAADEETEAADRVVELNEKWYDNGQEKMVDEWQTELLLEGAHDTARGPRRILHQTESGRKHTDRYSDGTQWGENWHQSRAASPSSASPSGSSSSERNAENADSADGVVSRQVTVQIRTPSGRFEVCNVEASAPVLRLSSRSRDNWWREPHGNSWGEKMYQDLEQRAEQHEKWYDNGHERQVDRWRVAPDGSRTGEKFGSKTDGTEWREAWGRQASDEGPEDSWIEKRWKECNQGEGVKEWGETEGSEGRKRWNQKWWKKESWQGGDEFVEKWEDDGYGNTSTVKQGSTWKHHEGGREVTDWFEDKFGVVEHSQEKWAYKQGRNASGDQWLEKWNEKPEEKTATKSGSNARGDAWSEQWKETFDENGEKNITWAEKTGRNAQGDSWYETWLERRANWKMAIKEGRNARGEEWQEKWGEDLHEDGSGEKWCQKWAKDHAGNRHGKSWGDRWGKDGKGGHKWGEEWSNEDVHKWWHDTDGRPAGC